MLPISGSDETGAAPLLGTPAIKSLHVMSTRLQMVSQLDRVNSGVGTNVEIAPFARQQEPFSRFVLFRSPALPKPWHRQNAR
jgi:hypothetical protein